MPKVARPRNEVAVPRLRDSIGLGKSGSVERDPDSATVSNKSDEYLADALAAMELAEGTTSTVEKRRLLKLAERWLDLADRVQKHSPDTHDHPLVKAKLGNERTDASA
jgi:hypothetical protein